MSQLVQERVLILPIVLLAVVLGVTYKVLSLFYLMVGLSTVGIILILTYRLIYGLGIIVFLIAFSPEIPFGGIPLRFEDLLLPIIFFFWLLKHISRHENLKPTTMTPAILCFLFFLILSTLNAFVVNPDHDRLRSFFHLLKHIEYFIFFFLALNLINSKADLQFLLYCTLIASVALSLYSITYSAVDLTAYDNSGADVGRVSGVTTETANVFGGYLLFHVLLALGFFYEEENLYLKLSYLVAAGIIFFPILFTMSRSSYVGLLAGFAFLGIVRSPPFLALIIVLPAVSSLIFPEAVINRFYSIYLAFMDMELTPSWKARVDAWKLFLPEVVYNPLLGKGLYWVPLGFIDNEYVLRAVEMGVLGLFSFLWVIITFFKRGFQLFKSAGSKVLRQVGLGYSAGMFGLMFHALAVTSFTTIRTAEPVFLLAGAVVSGYLIRMGRKDPKNHSSYMKSVGKKSISTEGPHAV